MAATKSGTVHNLFNAQLVTAGTSVGGVASSWQTLTTSYGSIVQGNVITTASAPGVGCTVQLITSNDATETYTFGQVVSGVAVSTTYPFVFGIPAPTQYCELTLGGNTTNSVTVNAIITTLTGI